MIYSLRFEKLQRQLNTMLRVQGGVFLDEFITRNEASYGGRAMLEGLLDDLEKHGVIALELPAGSEQIIVSLCPANGNSAT